MSSMSSRFMVVVAIVAAMVVGGPALAEPPERTSSQTQGVRASVVAYSDGDLALEGYFARPEGDADAPLVVIVHAWRGHSEYVRRRAEMLAELGYAAFALDMYGRGVYAENSQDASRRAGGFYGDRDLLRSRFKAGLDAALRQDGVDGERTAAIGYCFGGTVVLEMARTGARVGVDLDAVCSFHGGLRFEDGPDPEMNTASLIANGYDDPVVPMEERRAFMVEMEDAGRTWAFIEFSNAVHSFTERASGERAEGKATAYDETADEVSWDAMRSWFDRFVKRAAAGGGG